MHKVDIVKLRAAMLAEYRDYPNPDNDPVTAFEQRAAPVIADFGVLMVLEHNERQTPDPVLIQGVASIAAIMMKQVIAFAPEHVKPMIINHALATLERFLIDAASERSTGELDIPTRDVGDA